MNIQIKNKKKSNFFTIINKKKIYKKIIEQEKIKKKINISSNNYLYKNKKLKKGVFLKKPKFREILYPFLLNLKLVHQYLKKK